MRRALLWLGACTLAVYAANRLLAGPTGLQALYFAGPNWQDPSTAASYVDNPPSTAIIKARRPDFAQHSFSVEWRGFVAVPIGGTYTFRTVSDDGSWVYVRGREVVANGGRHPATEARGSIALASGVHSIFIRYFQDQDDCVFEFSWSRDGRAFEPVPASALLTKKVSNGQAIGAWLTGRALTLLTLTWYLVAAGALLTLVVRGWHWVFSFRPEGIGSALGSVLLLSVLLDVWGIWWAMPNTRGWAPDELVPADVLAGFQKLFSHGWYEKYPPFHYLLLSAADSPLLVLSWLGLVDVNATAPYAMLFLIGRLVSVLFGVATIVVVYRCGLQLYSHRGATFAALTTALTVPFAYYSKLANLDVPYLFWFAVSLFAYIRILQRHARSDYLLFAVSAALAGCTKDQAWGLYLLTPLAILAARWRLWKDTGGSAVRIAIDSTTLQALAAGFATFVVADNLVFNFGGFVAHVKLLLGTPAAFQEFPRTAAGQLQMAWRAIQEMRYMFGWPLAIVAAVAVVRSVGGRTTTPSLHWLLVPALSYYATFVGVILFFFDRYLLPITIVLSLYIGFWLDGFVAPGVRARAARIAFVSAAFVYSALYVIDVDYAMTVDSRYAVTRWLHAHARPDDVIGSLGPLEYQMIADGVRSESVESVDDLAAIRPAFVVLDADQMPTLSPRIQAMQASLIDGRSGYRLAGTFRSASLPLPGKHPDLGDTPRHGPEFSDLSMINPTMEVFERVSGVQPQ